jgi:hypothetical protein
MRSEAARFREMAEAVTDREASRQRLLGMAADYEARAAAADLEQPPMPAQDVAAEPEAESAEPVAEAEPTEKARSRTRLRLTGSSTRSARQSGDG